MRQKTTSGKSRRVGIEIEYIGLDVAKSAQLVQDCLGGEQFKHSDYEVQVANTQLGDFRVELDFALLKRLGQERASGVPDLISQMSEEVLATLAQPVTPCEIISSPILFAEVSELDQLIEALHKAGAQGTSDGLLYAFGLHFNPQVPDTEAKTILAYLKTFVLLYEWLKKRLRVDLSRRITPFIDPYPSAYVQLLLTANYQPDLDTLIADYLRHNPTRNRALDMLPLFTELDSEQVAETIDDPLIKARPTFHYRLSNCRVGDPKWRLTHEWQYWLLIEQLAARPDLLTELTEQYWHIAHNPLQALGDSWPLQLQNWLQEHELCPPANP